MRAAGLERGIGRGDHRAAQAGVAVVQHQRLPGRDRALRPRETHRQGAVVADLDPAGLIHLAVAGLRGCKIQPYGATPRPVWNPDIDQPIDFYDNWMTVPTNQIFDNGFKIQWEMFLRHVVLDTPWQYGLLEGAKGVQLAEAGIESWEERCWVDLETLPE